MKRKVKHFILNDPIYRADILVYLGGKRSEAIRKANALLKKSRAFKHLAFPEEEDSDFPVFKSS